MITKYQNDAPGITSTILYSIFLYPVRMPDMITVESDITVLSCCEGNQIKVTPI